MCLGIVAFCLHRVRVILCEFGISTLVGWVSTNYSKQSAPGDRFYSANNLLDSSEKKNSSDSCGSEGSFVIGVSVFPMGRISTKVQLLTAGKKRTEILSQSEHSPRARLHTCLANDLLVWRLSMC